MIKTYEGFFDFFKKKKINIDKTIDKTIDNTTDENKPSITHIKILEIGNEVFNELKDRGYTIKFTNNISDDITSVPENESYVQITKHPFKRRSGELDQSTDIPIKFIDIKDDILTFNDIIMGYNVDISYSYVYEKDGMFVSRHTRYKNISRGGLSRDNVKGLDFENGSYDDRYVSILTIYIKMN